MKNCNILIIAVLMVLTSCSTKSKLIYLQGLDETSISQINQEIQHNYELRISKGDALIITISGLDPDAVAPFNLPLISHAQPGNINVSTSPALQYYVVDNEGYINFPVLGKVKLDNYTLKESTNILTEKLSAYLKDPVVSVRHLNYQITILGEVNSPGRYEINSHRISIFDALGLASDMTIFGERKNVLVLRDNNGTIEFGRVDLTSSDILTSSFYYLQQNDVVYVEPNTNRAIASQNVNLYLSILSTLTTVSAVVFSFLN